MDLTDIVLKIWKGRPSVEQFPLDISAKRKEGAVRKSETHGPSSSSSSTASWRSIVDPHICSIFLILTL